jgi:hypothetical protein
MIKSFATETFGSAAAAEVWPTPRFWWVYESAPLAILLLRRRMMAIEILLGRGLALCFNPTAAWRVLSRRGRAFVVGAYAGAGFLATLTLLVFAS